MLVKEQLNQTSVTTFLLLGFTVVEQTRFCLLIILSSAYITTIAINIFIIVLIKEEPHLHKPMYFFIGGLSFLEIWYPSVTVPRLLWSLQTKDQHISLALCITQCYFHFSFGATEMFLLTAMSYDRYVAICDPLRYLIIISSNTCAGLILGAWSGGFIVSIGALLCISTLWFCKGNTIDHYYCDFAPIIHLSCSDTTKAEGVFFYSIIYVTGISILLTLVFYTCITRTITKSPSAFGKGKAVSTVVAHLFVVVLFYGTILFMFARKSGDSLHLNKMVSIVPSVVTPLLNPIIYTLRNQEVKKAVVKAAQKIKAFQVDRFMCQAHVCFFLNR